MAVDLFGPVNKIINQTTTQIVDDQLPKKMANALNSFVNAVFDTHETDLAMSFVGPIRTYPYVTREDVESTIQDFVKKRCATVANSEGVGKPGADLFIPEISAADTAKGITARIAWLVASKYRCGSQNYDADSITLVFLEKISGKWVITKCMFYYGTVSDFVG